MKRWLISDLHFGHTNIIKYENRPFETTEEMDETLIKNWNEVVNRNDKIFVLGDFCFKFSQGKTLDIVNRLNGHKTIVLGNHDRCHSVVWWHKAGFQEVSQYPIIVDDFYIFSHESIYLNENMPYVNIHGHSHSKKLSGKQHFNVSVENIDYTPVDFEMIKEIYSNA